VQGKALPVDATKIRANADRDPLVPRFFPDAKADVAELFADDAPTVAADPEEALGNDLLAGVRRLPREPPGEG
jgi:hypothetical protein